MNWLFELTFVFSLIAVAACVCAVLGRGRGRTWKDVGDALWPWRFTKDNYTQRASITFIANEGGMGQYNNVDVAASGIGEFTRKNIIRWLEELNGAPDPFPIKPVRDVQAIWGNTEIPWATEEGRKKSWSFKEQRDELLSKLKNRP